MTKCLCEMPYGTMLHPKCPIHAPLINGDIVLERILPYDPVDPTSKTNVKVITIDELKKLYPEKE